ncbi:uncharacterized protein [Trachinotus anak]|uniref:uncharacterized protein n=1 Tax=Trachinotus anak TaxID=443729 RepID=UPI0039F2005A
MDVSSSHASMFPPTLSPTPANRRAASGSNYPISCWSPEPGARERFIFSDLAAASCIFQPLVCRSRRAEKSGPDRIMSAAPGRMMMARVWVGLLTLARLHTADTHREADGGLAGQESLFSDSEPPGRTRSGGGFFPVPVWRFVKERGDGGEASGFGRPQFRCSDRSLSVRFPLIRHSDLRLQDGRRLLLLPDQCGGSFRTFGPWLLLKLPYTSCHMELWISNGTWFRQLKLRYFDHLLQANVMGVASCENPATSLQLPLPLVTCGATDVTVKLPLGTRLKRVKALGKEGAVGRAITAATPGAVLVQIPTPVNTDSILELIYFDSAGELSTMLAACFTAVTQSGRGRRPRALEEPDLWELWDFDEVPLEPYSPETTPTTQMTEVPWDDESTTTVATVTMVTTEVTFSDAEIFELWGFDEIPDGPYTGDKTTTAPPTRPTTSTPTTSTTTTGSASTTSAALTTNDITSSFTTATSPTTSSSTTATSPTTSSSTTATSPTTSSSTTATSPTTSSSTTATSPTTSSSTTATSPTTSSSTTATSPTTSSSTTATSPTTSDFTTATSPTTSSSTTASSPTTSSSTTASSPTTSATNTMSVAPTTTTSTVSVAPTTTTSTSTTTSSAAPTTTSSAALGVASSTTNTP